MHKALDLVLICNFSTKAVFPFDSDQLFRVLFVRPGCRIHESRPPLPARTTLAHLTRPQLSEGIARRTHHALKDVFCAFRQVTTPTKSHLRLLHHPHAAQMPAVEPIGSQTYTTHSLRDRPRGGLKCITTSKNWWMACELWNHFSSRKVSCEMYWLIATSGKLKTVNLPWVGNINERFSRHILKFVIEIAAVLFNNISRDLKKSI